MKSDNMVGADSDSSELLFDNRGKKKSAYQADRFFTAQEAATYLGVSAKFIYRRIALKEIDVQPIGRLRRIRLSSLESWLLRQKEEG